MKIKKYISHNWKFIVYPTISFIVVFAVTRSLFPLLKDWTWKATLCGCICGLIAAVIEIIKLFSCLDKN